MQTDIKTRALRLSMNFCLWTILLNGRAGSRPSFFRRPGLRGSKPRPTPLSDSTSDAANRARRGAPPAWHSPSCRTHWHCSGLTAGESVTVALRQPVEAAGPP